MNLHIWFIMRILTIKHNFHNSSCLNIKIESKKVVLDYYGSMTTCGTVPRQPNTVMWFYVNVVQFTMVVKAWMGLRLYHFCSFLYLWAHYAIFKTCFWTLGPVFKNVFLTSEMLFSCGQIKSLVSSRTIVFSVKTPCYVFLPKNSPNYHRLGYEKTRSSKMLTQLPVSKPFTAPLYQMVYLVLTLSAKASTCCQFSFN